MSELHRLNLAAAHALAERGLFVFPACAGAEPNEVIKRPRLGCYWLSDATTSAAQIDALWRRWPESMPAIHTGKSGIFVVDADSATKSAGHADGVGNFRAMARNVDSTLPPSVITPSGGEHFLFRDTTGGAFGNSGALAHIGCDIRSGNGFVVGAGAVLATGEIYDGRPGWHAFHDVPQFIRAAIAAHQMEKRAPIDAKGDVQRLIVPSLPAGSGTPSEAWVRKVFEGCLSSIASAGKGGSNTNLNNQALRLFRVALAADIPPASVAAQIEDAAWGNPAIQADGRGQMLATIRSAREGAQREGPALDVPQDRDSVQVARGRETTASLISASERAAEARGAAPEAVPLDSELSAVFFSDFTIQAGAQLIRKWLPAQGLIVDGGKSRAGKTFCVVDQCIALAGGAREWCGEPIRERVGVIYLAGEGQATIQRRFIAAAKARGVELERLPIAVTTFCAIDLLSPTQRPAIIATLNEIARRFQEEYGVGLGLIVIDTARACADMKDENDNSEVARVLKVMRGYGDHYGAAVQVVHHAGKGKDATLSGGGAWVSQADHSRLFLHDDVKPGERITGRYMALEKSRIGEIGFKVAFDLQGTDFGFDDYGDPINEAHVVWSDYGEKGKRAKADKGLTTAEVNRLHAHETRNHFEECYAFVSEEWKPSGAEPQPWPGAVPLKLVRKRFQCTWIADCESEEIFDADGQIVPGDAHKIKNKAFDNAVRALVVDGTLRKEKVAGAIYLGPRITTFLTS